MFKKMVQYQRYQQWKKGDELVVCLDEESVFENTNHTKRSRLKLLFLLLLSFISFSFFLAPHFFTSSSTFSLCKFFSFSSLFLLFALCFLLFKLFSLSDCSVFWVFADSFGFEDEGLVSTSDVYASVCSSVSNG